MSFIQTHLTSNDLSGTLSASPSAPSEGVVFGPYHLDPARRRLQRRGEPVALGGRAMDLLIALAARPGEVVPHQALFGAVWPGQAYVEDANLRVHIGALRKALSSDDGGHCYIANVSGRGYRLDARPQSSPVDRRPSLPALPGRLIGREHLIHDLAARLPGERLLTLTGPGGIGKSSLAIAVARALAPGFGNQVVYVDLSETADGLAVIAEMAQAAECLVILDNCDRFIDAAAGAVEAALRLSEGVRFLATSRQPLRIPRERVRRVPPLDVPSDEAAPAARDHAALQLFVARAEASLDSFRLDDADLAEAIAICRTLDGNPLAIELVAGRIDVCGIRGLAARMSDPAFLLNEGWRAATPRHRSIAASLAWSLERLPPAQLQVLARLAAETGPMRDDERPIGEPGALTALVEKSLVVADFTGPEATYAVSFVTRAYLHAAGC